MKTQQLTPKQQMELDSADYVFDATERLNAIYGISKTVHDEGIMSTEKFLNISSKIKDLLNSINQ